MADQKIDNLLNLAMEAASEERIKSKNLNVGYDPEKKLWDVIVKYSGSAEWTGRRADPGSPSSGRLCS